MGLAHKLLLDGDHHIARVLAIYPQRLLVNPVSLACVKAIWALRLDRYNYVLLKRHRLTPPTEGCMNMDSPWVPGDGTPICVECTRLLNAGAAAVRRHGAVASQAVDVARSNPTEERRRQNR